MDVAEDIVRSPERDLVVAILDEARIASTGVPTDTASATGKKRRREIVIAQDWFRSASEEPWTFRWCCGILNQDADTILSALENKFVTTTPAEIEVARAALKTATPAARPSNGTGFKPCAGVPNTSRSECGEQVPIGVKFCKKCASLRLYHENKDKWPSAAKPTTPPSVASKVKAKAPLKSAASTGAVGGAIASIERERQELVDGIDEMKERVEKIDQALKTLRSLA